MEIRPELTPHFDSQITLASLMAHRAGLGDDIDDDAELPFAHLDVDRLDSPEAFLPHVLQVARYESGAFRYSSAGYVLLGLAIEALTGEPFATAIEQWVTSPIGLEATGFPPLADRAADVAVGYLKDGRPNLGHLPPVGGPDGGIVTRVEDLERFFGALQTDDLIGKDTRRFLWQDVTRFDDGDGYSHGFMRRQVFNHQWYGHTGADPGLSAMAVFSPTGNASIVVLSNREGSAFCVFRAIVTWLEEEGLPPSRDLRLGHA